MDYDPQKLREDMVRPEQQAAKEKQTLQNGKASAIFLAPDCRNVHQQI